MLWVRDSDTRDRLLLGPGTRVTLNRLTLQSPWQRSKLQSEEAEGTTSASEHGGAWLSSLLVASIKYKRKETRWDLVTANIEVCVLVVRMRLILMKPEPVIMSFSFILTRRWGLPGSLYLALYHTHTPHRSKLCFFFLIRFFLTTILWGRLKNICHLAQQAPPLNLQLIVVNTLEFLSYNHNKPKILLWGYYNRRCEWRYWAISQRYLDVGSAPQVALVVKNLPANAGSIRDSGSIPG